MRSVFRTMLESEVSHVLLACSALSVGDAMGNTAQRLLSHHSGRGCTVLAEITIAIETKAGTGEGCRSQPDSSPWCSFAGVRQIETKQQRPCAEQEEREPFKQAETAV